MRRRAAILTVMTLAAVAFFLALDGVQVRKPLPAPPCAKEVAEGAVFVDPGFAETSGSPARPEQETTTPGEAPPAGPRRPRPTELVFVDGSTGLMVRTEPIAFTRRIQLAADRVPSPFVADADSVRFAEPLSVFAERVRLTAVVWPELDLTVRIEEADGTAAHGVELSGAYFGDRSRPFVVSPVGTSGEFRIRRLPWMREESVSVIAEARGGRRTTARALTGLLPEDPVRVRIRNPALEDPIIRDAKISDHNETDNDLPFEESLGANDLNPRLRLRVRVFRADGSPADGAMVAWYSCRPGGGFDPCCFFEGRTNADGVLLSRLMGEEKVGIAVREAGFLFGDPVLAAPALDPVEVILREAPGADLVVFVVDGEGRPLPGAKITVDLPYWVWLEDGLQQFGLFTGTDGSIRLPRLPLKEVTIRARYGSREAKVVARPPGSAELRLPRRR